MFWRRTETLYRTKGEQGRGHVKPIRCSNCSRCTPYVRKKTCAKGSSNGQAEKTKLLKGSRSATWSNLPLFVSSHPFLRNLYTQNMGLVGNMICADSCTSYTGDISDASVFPEYAVPKMYLKLQYCVSCAIHGKIVRSV